MTRVAFELRGRVAWRWLPIAAVLSAALSYALHHALPFDEHDVLVAGAIVTAAAVMSVAFGVLARPAERQLPVVVPIQAGAVGRREMCGEHLGFAAALHAETLDHGFFAALGFGFLRAYYGTFVASPHAVAVVAVAGGVPVGLVAGPVDARAHTRWVLRRRGFRLVARGAVTLLLRPRPALRFARTRIARYRGAWRRARSEAPVTPPDQSQVAVLSHVAVMPGAHGAGIGGELVDAFVSAAAARGADRVVLVTLEGEEGAGGFYERLGWRATGGRETFD